MTFRYLQVRREGAVEHLTLHRPEVKNAFNQDVIAELMEWARAAAADATLRAVVLRGAGTVFSAGADANWMATTATYSQQENVADAQRMAEMFSALDTLPVALIGGIHGAALGGGAGLVAVCDIVVATDDTVFGFSETKLGILPAVISPFVLPKIGVSAARELFLTGMRFPAARAQQIGLVHRVVPAADLENALSVYLGEILSAAPSGVARAKSLIAHVAGQTAEEARAFTTDAIATQRVSAEGQEGLRAFLEKRKARWTTP